MSKLDEHVEEVLTFGSKERLVGVIDHYEGSTLFIRSGDRFFFAFTAEALGFQPGALVSFRNDGSWRARDIIEIEPEKSHGA